MANESLKFIPNHASIYFNIANILGKKGKYEDAEFQFKQAISRDPTAPTIYANLGILRNAWRIFYDNLFLSMSEKFKNAVT